MLNIKPIKGFEDYLITSSGNVFNNARGKHLEPRITTRGYYQVCLYKNGKTYYKLISRLVAQAFISNPDNKPQVNHKDGNKANNDFTNLEWVTAKENVRHARRFGFMENSGKRKIPVNVYDYYTEEYKSTHPSINEAGKYYKLDNSHISKVINGKRKHTGGLIFKKI